MVLGIAPIYIGHLAIFIDVAIACQIIIYRICLVISDGNNILSHSDFLSSKVRRCRFRRSFIQVVFYTILQARYKLCISLTGNDREFIDILDFRFQDMRIHSITILIDTDSKTSSYFLTLFCWAIATMLQGTNLEYIRIIPPLLQGRVRKDKANWIVKRQQLFFIFQNQLICRFIVTTICTTFDCAVNLMALFIDTEIASMCARWFNTAKILLIG